MMASYVLCGLVVLPGLVGLPIRLAQKPFFLPVLIFSALYAAKALSVYESIDDFLAFASAAAATLELLFLESSDRFFYSSTLIFTDETGLPY